MTNIVGGAYICLDHAERLGCDEMEISSTELRYIKEGSTLESRRMAYGTLNVSHAYIAAVEAAIDHDPEVRRFIAHTEVSDNAEKVIYRLLPR